MIAAQLLRPQDRALLTELHPSDFPLLRNNFKRIQEYHDKIRKWFPTTQSDASSQRAPRFSAY